MSKRLRRTIVPVLATAVVLGVLLVGVFPTRTFLAQRAALHGAEEQLAVLREENEALEARARHLHDDAEIERLAREQYNLVRPGEEAYAVLPPPERPRPDPKDEPGPRRNVVQRVWHTVTGWLPG